MSTVYTVEEHNRVTVDLLSPTMGIELPGVPEPVTATKPSESASGGLVRGRRQHITRTKGVSETTHGS